MDTLEDLKPMAVKLSEKVSFSLHLVLIIIAAVTFVIKLSDRLDAYGEHLVRLEERFSKHCKKGDSEDAK